MRVVLDTNIVCADFQLAGRDFQIFFGGLERTGSRCYLPQVVIDEVLGIARRNLEAHLSEAKSARTKWHKIVNKALFDLPAADALSAGVKTYSEHLASFIRTHSLTVLPYPIVSHEALVRRAIERRKPFSESGSGYRDALIWQSVLSCFEESADAIHFITNNSRDFGTAPTLHEDLSADLSANHVIHLHSSLDSFNKAHILPHLEKLDGLLKALNQESSTSFSVKDWIRTEMADAVERAGLACALTPLYANHAGIWMKRAHEPVSYKINDVRRLSTGEVVVYGTATAIAQVRIQASFDEYEDYADVRDLFEKPIEGERAMVLMVSGSFDFRLFLDRSTTKIESGEVQRVQSEHGWARDHRYDRSS